MSHVSVITTIAGAVCMVLSPQAPAAPLSCTEDARTNAYFCFASTEIRESGGIRAAPLYTGGPNAVRRSRYTIAANCATGVMHLKDRDGVSFAGVGPGQGTEHSIGLLRDFCAAPLPGSKKK